MTKWLITTLLVMTCTAASAAELRVPEQFDVLVVNGKEFPTTLSREKLVRLNAGRNIVIVEYDQIFDVASGDGHDRVRSAPFALVFNIATADTLQLVGPLLSNGADAKRYVVAPTVQVLDSKQQLLDIQQLPVTDFNGLLVADSTSTTAAMAGSTSKPTSAPAPDALQMLSYWWQQASAEQRAAFLQQITR